MHWDKEYGKTAACILLVVLLISLLPIMYLGRYNHPTGDDYYYGAATRRVWVDTGSLLQTMEAAVQGVKTEYMQWQGTYSAMFLMYLPPNVFGHGGYIWVTPIILTMLTGSIFYLLHTIICCLLGGSRQLWLSSASIISLLSIQTVPWQGESFFWYNGSMYYTGYLAITFFFCGLVCHYLHKPRWAYIPVLVLLAAFLGGGNYVSLLPTLILMLSLTAVLIIRHSSKCWGIGIASATLLAGLALSAKAPGNVMRQEDMWNIPAWKAIAKALVQGIHYFRAWAGAWWLLGIIILTPIIWNAWRSVRFTFPYPVPVIGYIYGIFCSMSCPTFFTMNSTGPARVVAIVYYGFILATFICYAYLLGYLRRRWDERADEGEENHGEWEVKLRRGGSHLLGVMAVLLVLLLGMRGDVYETTTAKALKSLTNGEAKAYAEEYEARIQLLEDDAIMEVVLKPYEHRPDMLYVGDFSSNPTEPTNQRVAQFFGKQSVRVGE